MPALPPRGAADRAASKRRPLWADLSAPARAQIERLLTSPVVTSQNCEGGFSPGFASRLTLADGRRAFVKAMDCDAWPSQALFHRDEARVAAALPGSIPAPRFLGSFDDGHWVALAFEAADGTEPAQPWNLTDLDRVLAAVGQLADVGTPSPVPLPRDHPRLGGWASLARDASRRARLPTCSAWAASHLPLLITLESEGLAAAQGPSLVPKDGHAVFFVVEPDRSRLVELAQRLRDGRLKPIVGAVRPLTEAPAAFAPDRRTPGKTIIRITEGG